jgi:hypothetical protein
MDVVSEQSVQRAPIVPACRAVEQALEGVQAHTDYILAPVGTIANGTSFSIRAISSYVCGPR